MKIHPLNDYSVYRLKPEASKFLQAYTSQVPQAPKGAFLDIKGNVIVIYRHILLDSDESIMTLPSQYETLFLQHVQKYLPLYATNITTLPDWKVYFAWDIDATDFPDHHAIPESKGFWLLGPALTNRPFEPEDAFTQFRVTHGIPLQGRDYAHQMLLNIGESPDYVSFTKGCYLGQEIIARVHFRSRPPYRLSVVNESELPDKDREQLTSRIEDTRGRVQGFAFMKN